MLVRLDSGTTFWMTFQNDQWAGPWGCGALEQPGLQWTKADGSVRAGPLARISCFGLRCCSKCARCQAGVEIQPPVRHAVGSVHTAKQRGDDGQLRNP